MDIAVLLPVTTRASEGLVKHINCLFKEWAASGQDLTVTMYLPEGLNILSSSYRVQTKHFPSNDYWFNFRRLSKLVAQGNHDLALVLIARFVDLGSLPTVTMVQNVEPIQKADYPTSLKWRLRLWVLRREHKRACHKATRVLVTTQHVKRCLFENLGVTPDKIDVIHFGIHPSEIDTQGTPPALARDLAPRSFIFSAGSLVPYRGMEDLVLAYGLLHREGAPLPVVAIAGEDRTQYGGYIKSLAQKQGVAHCFRWLGQISQDQMTWCYQQSRAFVLTTRAESFCNIALEAMGHGCACIICDHDPMPEVCQDAPLYYKWGDAESLAGRLSQVIAAGESDLNPLKERGRLHSANFSWPEIAVATLNLLKKTIHHEI